MRAHRFLRFLSFLLFAVAVAALAGYVVMRLWNWLIPALFAGPTLHFVQALGLLVLTRLLFGRLGGGHRRLSSWRGRKHRHWRNLSPEERQQLRAAMFRRFGVDDSSKTEL
jgi:hypothetical protein